MRAFRTGSGSVNAVAATVGALLRQRRGTGAVCRAGVAVVPLAGSLLGVIIAGPALAADQPQLLEEIVVTAQKRSESLQTVPVAVSVVSGEQLQQAGISNAESLQDVVPSLTF